MWGQPPFGCPGEHSSPVSLKIFSRSANRLQENSRHTTPRREAHRQIGFLLVSSGDMRAAAILGLSSSEKDLEPFKRASIATWSVGVPASASSADVILIFGGDGTVHRHLAQLVRLQLPVLVVPCGSGNDFARALNLRSDLGCARVMAAIRSRQKERASH